jgi:hypothetical protein
MARFVIAPHMRLHEWVAEEKGYFADAGPDYEFRDELRSPDGRRHDLGDRVGAYQTLEKCHTSDISCARHWTVNSKDVFEQALRWIAEREIFAADQMGAGRHESALLSLA